MKNLIPLALLSSFVLPSYSQQEALLQEQEVLKNFGYLELGGRFIAGFGVHYERRLRLSPSFSFTGGVGAGSSHRLDQGNAHWPLIVPISAGILVGKKINHFELGASRLLVRREFYEDPEDGIFLWPITAYIGYRKLPEDSQGFFYKINGLVYPVDFLGALPFLAFGLGYQF